MYEFEKEKITDLENGFMYVNLPKPNYKQVMVSTKKFVNDIKLKSSSDFSEVIALLEKGLN